MDLTSIQQQLLTQLSSSTGTRPLLDLSQVQPGSSLIAKVEAIQQLPPEVQRRIIEVLNESLTKSSHIPDKKSQASETAANHPVLTKTPLFAVRLNIQGKSLLTFSNAALSPKQSISVSVRTDGQLQLNSTNKSFLSPISESGEKFTAEKIATERKSNNLNRANIESISAQALRQYLPKQTQLSDTFTTLKKILNTHQQLLQATNKSPLTDLVKIIRPIIKNTHDINQVMDEKQLKPLMEKSGAFLESRIAKAHIEAIKTENHKPQVTQGQVTKEEKLGPDIKAELLRAVEHLIKIPTNNQRPENNQGTLDKLLQQLLSPQGKAATELKNAEQILHSALKARIEKAVSSSLARITTLQIQHLLQKLSDPTATRLGGMFELPIRLGENIYPLTLNIQEKIYEEKEEEEVKKEDKKREKKVKKRWQVYLEFDLDELGSFASEITLKDEHISSKFWIQKSALWQESQKHLEELKIDLENAGVFVEELQCHQGNAPSKEMKVSHALVDIKT